MTTIRAAGAPDAPSVAREKPATGQVVLIALLFVLAIISYIDRGSLSIAAPMLSKEMNLSPSQMGVLLSSFFWTYALLQIAAGWLVDRYPMTWILAGGVFVWSIATLLSGFAAGAASLIVFRLLLGAGEAVMFPCFSKAVAGSFAPGERGLPNSIIDAGTKLGPALGVLIGGLLVAQFGWRVLFIVLGVGSLFWLAPWLLWSRRKSARQPEANPDAQSGAQSGAQSADMSAAPGVDPADKPTMMDLLRTPDVWGTVLGASSYTYAIFFLLTWLPSYLVNERGMSLERMAILGSLPYWASAIAAVATGWVSDYLIRSGRSPTLVRKSIVVFGLLLSIVALPSALVNDEGLSIALLSLAYVAFGIFASNLWAISQTLAGPAAAGRWAGLQNSIGATMGIAAPLITGFIVEQTGSFTVAFAVTAVLAVGGAAAYIFMVGKIAPIDWGARRRKRLAPRPRSDVG